MPRYTDKQIEAALTFCKGMVYVAANHLGCDPATIKARLAKSQHLQEVLKTAREFTTDTAELKLYDAILKGEPWAIQFYLRTQGKSRGYNDSGNAGAIIAEIIAEITRLGLGGTQEGAGGAEGDSDTPTGYLN